MSEHALLPSAVVAIASDVLSSELGSEHVLLSLRDGTYYGLEDVGGEVWRLLHRPTSLDEICRHIVDIYDVDPARCRRDVEALIVDLADRHLIEIRHR